MDVKIPINLHISNQALSAGLKPISEKFYQSDLEFREEYSIFFG